MTITDTGKLKMLTDKPLQGLVNIIIIIGALFTAVTWALGGLHPDTVNQIAAINLKVADIQASQTRQATDIQNVLTSIKDKIDSMPRPSDFTAQESHMTAIDTSIARLGQQIQTDEVDSARLQTMVQSLIDGTQAKTARPR